MRKLPILFLAPTPNMAAIAPRIARELGIEIVVEAAWDETALALIGQHSDWAEIVVSRGGIAEIVRKGLGDSLSLVEVTMTISDLLELVSTLSRQGIQHVGVVSQANLFDGLSGNFHIGQTEIVFRAGRDLADISRAITSLREQGIQAIIGCRYAYEVARQCAMTAVFLESSPLSIRKALNEAIRILHAKARERLQAAQLRAIIDNIEEGVIAVEDDGTVSFSNRSAQKVFADIHGKPDFSTAVSLLREGRNTRTETEKITTVNDHSLVARVIPLRNGEQKSGNVITFQEVSKIQASETRIRISTYQRGLYAKHSFDDIIGDSQPMRQLIAKARTYSAYDSNLLIHGETGTGKEIFAQSVHNQSPRRKGPFVSVNTASISPSLLESELFGYVEGAFTGARRGGKPGLFEMAHRGTIFLDEIGELTPDIQSRLLRVLQEKEIMRIGDDRIIPIDVRIISATNRNLFELTQSGKFRQDLYYRIHVLGLFIPPLRVRRDDIPMIFKYFLDTLGEASGHFTRLAPDAHEVLMAYPWPGNVRQLRNIAEVVVYNDEDVVTGRHIADVLEEREQGIDIAPEHLVLSERGTLKDMEGEIIRLLLTRHSPDDVCRRLGISRVTLWRKMKKASLV